MTLSKDTDHLGNLQTDWTRSTPGKTQPKLVVSDVSFPWRLSPCKKRIKIWFNSFQQCYNKRILQSDWMKDTPCCTKPKWESQILAFLDNNLHAKKTKASLDSFQGYWWSKNPQRSHKFAILKSSDFSRFSRQNVKNLPDFLIILTLQNGDNRKNAASYWSNYFIGRR